MSNKASDYIPGLGKDFKINPEDIDLIGLKKLLGVIVQPNAEPKPTHAISRNKWYSGTSNGTDVDVTFRTKHEVLCDCHTIKLVYGNFYQDDDPARLANLSDYTLNCTIEYGGKLYQVTFGGKKSVTVQTGCRVISDPIGLEFTKGQTFFIRQHVVVPTSGKFPTGLIALGVNSEGKANGDQTLATSFTSFADVFALSPYAIYATPTDSRFKAVACVGDSISTGAGNPNTSIEGHIAGDIGFMQMAAMRVGYGYSTLGMNGQSTEGFTQFKRINRMVLANDCSIGLCNYGTNDLSAQVSLATIKANLLDIWKALKSRGLSVYQTTITPRTTSTDNWTTVANQTPVNAHTAGGPNSPRSQLNAWIRSVPSVYLDGYIEVADVVETDRDSGLWKPGTTSDGIHPNALGHLEISKVVEQVLRKL